MWHARLRGRTSGPCAVSQPRPGGLGGMQIVDHMLPFMSLSLFVSALSLSRSGAQSKSGLSARRNKRERRYPILSATLTARSSCGNVKQGWDERSVAGGMKLLTPHFLSFPVLKLLFVTECFRYVQVLSLVTCAFHPTSTGGTQHMLSRKLLLVSHLFCGSSGGGVLFVWTYSVCFSP